MKKKIKNSERVQQVFYLLGQSFSVVSIILMNPFMCLQQIEGEVHSVDADMLAWLDDFEDHPEVYTRREIPVILDSQSQVKY